MPRGGKREGAGRKLGSKNKITQSVAEAIERAFHEVGGHEYLVQQARETPQAFMVLLGKLLPTQLTGKDGGPIEHALTGHKERLATRIAELSARSEAPGSDQWTH